jgi:hypothetical protein
MYAKQAKKTKQPITDYRMQTIVSKKRVSKLAVVRARIKRRIREAAKQVFPKFARVRGYLGGEGVVYSLVEEANASFHRSGRDYVFFANLETYSAPWPKLISAMENAMKNPRLYHSRTDRLNRADISHLPPRRTENQENDTRHVYRAKRYGRCMSSVVTHNANG